VVFLAGSATKRRRISFDGPQDEKEETSSFSQLVRNLKPFSQVLKMLFLYYVLGVGYMQIKDTHK